MMKSMTGFGRGELQLHDMTIIVEAKSLNGKQLDVNLKLATAIKPYEIEIRKLIQQELVRGTVEVAVYFSSANGVPTKNVLINQSLIKNYYQQLISVSEELSLDKTQLLNTLLSLPEVVTSEATTLTDQDWLSIKAVLSDTLHTLDSYRATEGKGIHEEIKLRINTILSLLTDVNIPEQLRTERIRERLTKGIQELTNLDTNRLEQEMIYYIERLDISEEKQRLAQHCHLLLELMDNAHDEGIGKKMNFILQEIGREINTLGSKANDADIQKIVVEMKDNLEKCKEQSLNVL